MKDVAKLSLRDTPGGVVLAIKAVPGSSRSKVSGVLGDALKVRVAAAPEKGRANAAIAELLAELLGVPGRSVILASGPGNPRKEFLITGLNAQQVRQRLEGL